MQAPTAPSLAGATGQATNGSARSSGCPPHVLEAIYGKVENKKEAYENSLKRWGAFLGPPPPRLRPGAGPGALALSGTCRTSNPGPSSLGGHALGLPCPALSLCSPAASRRRHYPPPLAPRWWSEYADRKNDEEEEYVANSLLYDRNHLPRMAPAPDCVTAAADAARAAAVAASTAGAEPHPPPTQG